MRQVEYGDRILEFPDSMSKEDMELAIRELPEEKELGEKFLPPSERYKTGLALEQINPTVAREVRRIALERKHGYIAKDPPSIANFIGNIPEDFDEFCTEVSSLIGMAGLFTYRFGRNFIQDINDITKRDFMAADKAPLPGRVEKQLTPFGRFGKAIYYDFKAMFTGDVPEGYRPITEAKKALTEKIERQGLGDTLKYWAQDNPVDCLLISMILKGMAQSGTRYTLKGIQKVAPKASKVAKTLDGILSTQRTPLIYSMGPKKDLAKISAKIQKDTATMLKAGGQIGGITLDDFARLAAIHPGKAVSHARRSKVPLNKVLEGLRNKGAKVVVGTPKAERPAVSKNLQLTVDRLDKLYNKQQQPFSIVAKQVRLTKKTGGSSFSATGKDLAGSDNFSLSIFPDYSQIVKGKITKKQLTAFYEKNGELLKQYPELAVGTWFDIGTKQTFMDLIVTVPTKHKFAALGLGHRYNQKAIFNLKTFEEIKTGGTGETIEKLPSIAERLKEIRRVSPLELKARTGTASLKHWSPKKDLKTVDPAKYGTGIKGAEAERQAADPANWVNRSYWGGEGYVPEPGLGKHVYEIKIPYKDLYDFHRDPLKLKTGKTKQQVLYRGAKTEEGLKGTWWTPSKQYAKHYTHGKGKIATGYADELKLLNMDKKQDFAKFKAIKGDAKTNKELSEKIVAAGYDGTSHAKGQEIHIYNSAKLPTAKAVTEGDPISLYEKAIKAAGFKGYYVDSPTSGNVIAMFEKIKTKLKPLPEKSIRFERTYSKDLLTKYIFQKTFDAGLEKFPHMKAALTEHKAKKLISVMRNASDEANFNERSKMHMEIYKQINSLSKEEQAIVVPYLEGRAMLISEPSEQFKAFEGWYRQLIDKHEAVLKKMGKLGPENKNRLYQPLAKATGQTAEQVEAEMGSFTPVYVHHTFPKMYDEKMGIHFAETTGKRFKPGFMKKCKGVQGYSEDFKDILPKYTSEYIKFKHTEQFIKDFTNKFGIRVNCKDLKETGGILHHGDRAYPGYKLVAPDGFLSYYRGKIDIQKEIINRMKDTTFDEAIGEIIAEMNLPIKSYLGVSKNKIVYLVPEKMLGELETFATPVFGSQKAQDIIRLVVDKPTQLWKDSVLLSPRWIKNNVMGDIIFNSTKGVGPLSYSRAFRSTYVDCIPDQLLQASFANVMKYNPKLGKTAKTAVGGYIQALYDTNAVSNIAKVKDMGYALNTMFEQPFVRALYIHLARKKVIQMLKTYKVPQTEVNILNTMRAVKANETLCGPIIEEVHKTLPVFNLLGNFERKYVRRFVPFANWYKFMIQYGVNLPAKHPFKLVGARGLCALSEEQRETVFKDYFPYMAREIDEAGIPNRFDHLWPVGEKGEEKAKFFNARGLNPFTTLQDFVDLDFMNMASPIITVPVEQMTGRTVFGSRKYESGEAGITITHDGIRYEEFAKVRPPIVEHILSQTPQYQRLKEWLVPARQWDTGTILNPDPILDPNTGEYKYPIESVERILNMLGVDQKTMDVREVWYKYQTRKAQALGRALSKHRENLSFQDIRDILEEIQKDKVLWEQLRNEMSEKAYYEEQKTQELMEKVR